jgi:FixJ family two-component response regulator
MKSETGARWMVVDHDAQTLETVATLLRVFSDVEICPFQSTTDALDAFVAAPDSFAMVITDFDMPQMNAVDFRRHLQTLVPDLKVFVITGSGMFTEENARRGGFCGLLRKPFTLGALKRAVDCAQSNSVARTV